MPLKDPDSAAATQSRATTKSKLLLKSRESVKHYVHDNLDPVQLQSHGAVIYSELETQLKLADKNGTLAPCHLHDMFLCVRKLNKKHNDARNKRLFSIKEGFEQFIETLLLHTTQMLENFDPNHPSEIQAYENGDAYSYEHDLANLITQVCVCLAELKKDDLPSCRSFLLLILQITNALGVESFREIEARSHIPLTKIAKLDNVIDKSTGSGGLHDFFTQVNKNLQEAKVKAKAAPSLQTASPTKSLSATHPAHKAEVGPLEETKASASSLSEQLKTTDFFRDTPRKNYRGHARDRGHQRSALHKQQSSQVITSNGASADTQPTLKRK